MEVDSGVFSVARDIWDHPRLGSREPFSKREAWMWIISAAAWRPYRCGVKGGAIPLNRGEFCFSLRFLETKWGWSKSRVERFLKMLENEDMIRDASRDGERVYSVSNYNNYQISGKPKRDDDRDAHRDDIGTVPGRKRDKEETFKHSNIKPEDTSSSEDVGADAPDHAEPAAASKPMVEPEAQGRGEVVAFPVVVPPEQAAFDAYNAVAAERAWPVAQSLTSERRKKLRARLKECGGVEGWAHAMSRARASPWLCGEGRAKGWESWRPDLDFFLQQKSFTALMEGRYDQGTGRFAATGHSAAFEGARMAIDRGGRTD